MSKKYDNFINIPFTIENLDSYFIRTSILNAINENLSYFKGKLLDFGCGKMPYKEYILEKSSISEYIGLDIENTLEYDKNIKPNYTWDGNKIPFENDSFNTIIATEVLEHCYNPIQTLKEIFKVLSKDGHLFITVPFLWTLHEVPHDEYRYTPFSLQKMLEGVGFKIIIIKSTGGWHASLAQMLGLWVRRSGLSKKKEKYMSKILKPIIKYLMKKDIPPTCFYEGLMIPSLYVLAKK